jgi:membrane protease YdiL (CAAX protease family)
MSRSRARAIFVAPDGRARAPWRILLFIVVWILTSVVVMGLLGRALGTADRLTGVEGTAISLGMVISLLLTHVVMLRLDRRPFAYVWLDRPAASPRAMAIGFAVGAAPIAAASLLLVAIGWLDIVPSTPGSWTRVALQVSLALLPAAFYEELLSRGYIFAALGEWLGMPVAIALTSIAFGLLHLGNPGANAMSITTVILAGVFLAATLVVTGSLYATWMAHWAWNWVMAVPFHVAVSGLPLARPDYQTVDDGPDWITGGPWGPEGGAGAAAAMIGGLVFLYMRRSRLSALGSRPSATEPLGVPAGSRERTAESR